MRLVIFYQLVENLSRRLGLPQRAPRVLLRGLDPAALYEVDTSGAVLSGQALMKARLSVTLNGAFASELIRFRRR